MPCTKLYNAPPPSLHPTSLHSSSRSSVVLDLEPSMLARTSLACRCLKNSVVSKTARCLNRRCSHAGLVELFRRALRQTSFLHVLHRRTSPSSFVKYFQTSETDGGDAAATEGGFEAIAEVLGRSVGTGFDSCSSSDNVSWNHTFF